MRVFIVIVFIFMGQLCANAQDSAGLYNKLYNLPDKFFGSINSKSEKFQQRIIKATDKYLRKLARQESKIQRVLAKKDSVAAKKMFGNIPKRYDSLRLTATASASSLSQVYSGRLDSMTTMLKFFDRNKVLSSVALHSTLNGYSQVQGKMNQSNFIQEQLKERQQLLKDQLQQFGLSRQFKRYQEKVYYYRAQVDEYKKIFEDPHKMEATLLQAATNIPAFAEFFRKNSQLGSLFQLPGSTIDEAASVTGLQTRDMLRRELEQRLGTGPDTESHIAQNIGNAQTNLKALKNKINESGNSGNEMQMPDFKPNQQKTKSFLKRVEIGTNMQSTKGTSFFPVTTDFGLSIGYKINSRSIIGIGTSYKMGWGKDFRHISISHEGLGFRSFYEFKLKGSFWITGGGEFNYRSTFKNIEQLKEYSAWQQSALLGLSKKYAIKNKLKGNVQIMFDFLHRQQTPMAQPLIFRFGYNIK